MVTAQAPSSVIGCADPITLANGRLTYAAEAMGTSLLVSTVGVAVAGASPFASLGVGAALIVLVYSVGQVTGGHYNPAVTLAVLLRRRITVPEAISYWVLQCGAGLLAAVVVCHIVDPVRLANTATMTLTGRALAITFLVGLVFTFALCYVVLDVATGKDRPGNSRAGLAAGVSFLALNPDDR